MVFVFVAVFAVFFFAALFVVVVLFAVVLVAGLPFADVLPALFVLVAFAADFVRLPPDPVLRFERPVREVALLLVVRRRVAFFAMPTDAPTRCRGAPPHDGQRVLKLLASRSLR